MGGGTRRGSSIWDVNKQQMIFLKKENVVSHLSDFVIFILSPILFICQFGVKCNINLICDLHNKIFKNSPFNEC